MAEIDYKQLEVEFKTWPPKLAGAVSVRAAMRALPLLARRPDDEGAFYYWRAEKRGRHLLAALRCYQTAVWGIAQAGVAASAYSSYAADAAYADAAAAANTARIAAARAAAAHATSAHAARAEAAYADAAAAVVRAARAAAATAAYSNATYADGDSVAAAVSAYAYADVAGAAASAANALQLDRAYIRESVSKDNRRVNAGSSGKSRSLNDAKAAETALSLQSEKLWPLGMPSDLEALWEEFLRDALALREGFEVWRAWLIERLEGKPLELQAEEQWALLTDEQLAQTPAEINAYLKQLRDGTATQVMPHVRALFIGWGETGKTSLVNVLNGGAPTGPGEMTKGVSIREAQVERREKLQGEIAVHIWDFGGQVMAHATHQFFLRSRCLYVIVLDGRQERNADQEAEYWLEHVRAFGGDAPVMLVGNKADLMPVGVSTAALQQKYPNIVGFYPLSTTEATGRFKLKFELFKEEFEAEIARIAAGPTQRFTEAQFSVLEEVRVRAKLVDFLSEDEFDELCDAAGIEKEGAGGRATLLDMFDKLGIVMHFPQLPFFSDSLLNPHWLTYGVYTIMYSEAAKQKQGRLANKDVVSILKPVKIAEAGRRLRYPPERCQFIVNAMTAFKVAYRMGGDDGDLVIPALLPTDLPDFDFDQDGALAFQFDCRGFLPRHVLPSLIVERHRDIARDDAGHELVWQKGVLLRPGTEAGFSATAVIEADYHLNSLSIRVNGPDAALYLGVLRDSVLRDFAAMPALPYEEKVLLRPMMRMGTNELDLQFGGPVWVPYKIVMTAEKNRLAVLPGPDGYMYELARVLSTMPSEVAPPDVFVSYGRNDRAVVDTLAGELRKRGISVWYDRSLHGGQRFAEEINRQLDAAKAVVALWTSHSVKRDWVRFEAERAHKQKKLIPLRNKTLDLADCPPPYASVLSILDHGDLDGLLKALAAFGVRGKGSA
jgi:GTPase SAR1 family protein